VLMLVPAIGACENPGFDAQFQRMLIFLISGRYAENSALIKGFNYDTKLLVSS